MDDSHRMRSDILAMSAIDDAFQDQIKRLCAILMDPATDNDSRFDHAMNGYRKAAADRAKFRKLIADSEPQ